MAYSEASASLNFYAEQLVRIRKCDFPEHIVWTLPSSWGQMGLSVFKFVGRQGRNSQEYNFYGDPDCTNVAFFFTMGNQSDRDKWYIIIHDYDDPKRPLEWSLNCPSSYRGGFPSDVERIMRQLIEGLFDYAKEFLDYKPEVSDEEMNAFFDGIAEKVRESRNPKPVVHQKECDCEYCSRIMRVFSHRVE